MIKVAAGVIFRSGKLLITQRRLGDHLGGLWGFPGGKLKSGEDYPDCLRRELAEELRVNSEVGALLCAVEHAYPEKTVHIHFYQCHLLDGEPEAYGCAALNWVSQDELGDYAFPSADRQILNIIQERHNLWLEY